MPAETKFKDPALAAERLPKLRAYIAKIPAKRFNMVTYFGEVRSDGTVGNAESAGKTNAQALEGSCGTCACIAGHALVAFEPDALSPEDVMMRASKVLGLRFEQAERLFEPNNFDDWFSDHFHLSEVKRAHALRVLDHLIATGAVDWSVARMAKA